MSTNEGDAIGDPIRTICSILVGLLVVAATHGCADVSSPTAADEDRVDPGPPPAPAPQLMRASPDATTLRVEPGEEIVFEIEAESSVGLALTIEFQVDGRTVSAGPRFVYSPTEPGTHSIRGVVTDGVSTTTREWTVTVERPANAAPGATLALDPHSGPAPLSVRLRLGGDDPDGRITTYRVTIDGPEPAELVRDVPIDTTLVLAAGTHAFEGVVVDDRGATATARDTVRALASRMNVAPTPLLTVSPDSGQAPLDVVVDGAGSDSDGSISRYELDLDGDGAFEASSRFPLQQSLRFEAASDVWIRLRVTDDEGAIARDSLRVVVTAPATPAPPPSNQAPSTTLTVTPTSGEAPLQITVDATASDPDGSIASLAVDLDGDGAFDVSGSDPVLSVGHVFDAPGAYTIRAVATDDDGASARADATVTVTEPVQNETPSGSLSTTSRTGDAPLVVRLDASGSDPDGSIETWEIEPDDGRGWIEIEPSGTLDVTYPFRDEPYVPRLRLTDDRGAETVVTGPEILVYRPVDPARSTTSVEGNAYFDGLPLAPAVWADGSDAFRFTIVVRDSAGAPLPDVPVRLRSSRDPLVAPDGRILGEMVDISLDAPRTDASGRVTARLTTDTSTRVDVVAKHTFTPFSVAVDADVGHGRWRPVSEVGDLQAESPVYAGGSTVLIEGPRQDGICPGDPVTIRVTAELRFDAPNTPGPAPDRYTVLRFDDQWFGALPSSDYPDWRTDGDGAIVFEYVPEREDDDKGIRIWVDGVPVDAIGLLSLLDESRCP